MSETERNKTPLNTLGKDSGGGAVDRFSRTVDTPLVSVYIATHNRAALLERAIDSVLAQTYPRLEVIVADDGSTDNTGEVLQRYRDDDRVSWLRNPESKGACVARNLAIFSAKGEYITGLDDDDVFTPYRLADLVAKFQQGEFSCVSSPRIMRTPTGDMVSSTRVGVITLEDLLHKNLLGSQVLTKTRYLQEIGGFDPVMPAFQDYDTWVRLVAKFGRAYKSEVASYIWHTDHVHDRISDNTGFRLKAFNLFNQKHCALFSDQHRASQVILRKRLTNEKYSFADFVRLTNWVNFRESLSLYMEQHLTFVKRLYNRIFKDHTVRSQDS